MDVMQRIIGFDPQLIFDAFITAINVLILFALLSYLLFEPARKLLNDRREKIKNELKDAEEKNKSANEMKILYEKKLQDAKNEANTILLKAKENAKLIEDELINKAKLEAKTIVDRGNREVLLEKQKAMDELKKDVVNMSTMIAEKIIKESIDEKKFSDIFDDTINSIEVSTWQN